MRAELICLQCARPFTPKPRSHGAKYCSPQCRHRAGNLREVRPRVRRRWDRLPTATPRPRVTAPPGQTHLACAHCGVRFARRFTLDGRPRGNESTFCSRACDRANWWQRTYGPFVLKPRPCRACGVRFTPARDAHAIYCSKRCGQRDWTRAQPEYHQTQERRARRAQRALMRQLLKALRRLLRLRRRQAALVRPTRPCAACGAPITIHKYCLECRQQWRRRNRARYKQTSPQQYRAERRRQKQRVVREVRDRYVARLLKDSVGISRALIPAALYRLKRAQIQFHRHIQESKHAIRKAARQAASPKE